MTGSADAGRKREPRFLRRASSKDGPRCITKGQVMTTSTKGRSRSTARWGEHDHTVLVLQGGGALGAYQAGAYAAVSESGIEPDWIAGVSIGAINAALIAGNPP